ncbi:MAG: Gfo/Idh/MocA family oxidoreductase [Ancrocorticia sp.]|uniref:Gfo/Idh/MocA family oxidoreductase n=1 Tax=Ancrocorticia sp. TaxID=2593684 RepID=UPI003F927D33
MKKIALVGAGRIGTHHARTIAGEVAGVELAVLADPVAQHRDELAAELNVASTLDDPLQIAQDETIDAVVITAPAANHVELITAFAAAGKHIFTEKPVAITVPDAKAAVAAAKEAGVLFQVGFNRRYAESWARAKEMVAAGAVGSVQRVHSMTRDPGPWPGDPAKVAPGTIFNETLIHDFDTINWLNEGAEPVEVYAVADALVAPEAKGTGFFDSSVVIIRYSNGAMATAEASFSAMYGYDLRGEVFGSKGMTSMGNLANTDARLYDSGGGHCDTSGTDTSRFHEAYRLEFQTFADLINGKNVDYPGAEAGIKAQLVAAAAIKSVAECRPVQISEVNE